MKISESIYKVSGVEYRTNSNIYAVKYEGGIVLIDSGYGKEQWERMNRVLAQWDMKEEDISHVFITHSHFDHAGNVWRMNEIGAKVLASRADAGKIENGNPEMEELFHAKWHYGKVDRIIKEGDEFDFPGNVRIEIMETPGHCEGALSFVIYADGLKAVCTGDMFFIKPLAPEDEVSVELGYMGSSDFSMKDFIRSLKRLSGMDMDIILPGHYYTYNSENAQEICGKAYDSAVEMAMKQEGRRVG